MSLQFRRRPTKQDAIRQAEAATIAEVLANGPPTPPTAESILSAALLHYLRTTARPQFDS